MHEHLHKRYARLCMHIIVKYFHDSMDYSMYMRHANHMIAYITSVEASVDLIKLYISILEIESMLKNTNKKLIINPF